MIVVYHLYQISREIRICGESRTLAPVRPRMQTAVLQCLLRFLLPTRKPARFPVRSFPRKVWSPKITGFQTGSGQRGGFHRRARNSTTFCNMLLQVLIRCHILSHVATCLSYVATCCPHFPMKVHYGKLRRFCDDPVCPDPVWKLSIECSDDTNV